MSPTIQYTLPLKRRGKGRQVKTLEKVVEKEADFELARRGFRFLNTTVRYLFFQVECPRCGHLHKVRNERGTGQDKGIPDRLVYSRQWWHPLLPSSLWLGIELKGSHTPFSCPEQKVLAETGCVTVARDGVTAREAAQATDSFFSYVERLELGVDTLLDALKSKSATWRDAARALEGLRREGAGNPDTSGDV